ncbi:hypothetical protein [Streptomyces sp. NPDC045251]|uniref:hypothetical protein n=1 Tax=unclassified Streptomyces TaxID=2593676 RepID=UPI0033E8EEAC
MEPEFITREELTGWADTWDRLAARAYAAARDGALVAADPARSEYTRACAARAAEIARGNAREYRAEALVMRDGEVPEPYWHVYTTEPPEAP